MTPSSYPQNGKYRYNIAMREPQQLPTEDLIIPPPSQAPSAPSPVSLLTLLLPPAIMIAGSIISTLLMGNRSLVVVLPMMLMGLGYPSANLINNKIAKKKYAEAVISRKENYIKTLREIRSRIEGTIERQKAVLMEEFPPSEQTISIGLAAGKDKRLWWRRSGDHDFLNLRLGSGANEPSFQIVPPNVMNQGDPLSELPFELIEHYEKIENLPFILDLKQLGSVTLFGDSFRNVLRLVRRLLVDLIVHHSPEDVNLFVLADRLNAAEQWEWLKWIPHTHALEGNYSGQNLLFTTDKINSFLDVLKKIHFDRLEKLKSSTASDGIIPSPAIIVVLDDNGAIRQHEDLRRIAAEGYGTGIYLLFVRNEAVPTTCRARIEIDNTEKLHYLESIDSQSGGNQRLAMAELLKEKDILPLARTLASLEVAGGKSSYTLPSTVRVVDILEGDPFSLDEIVARWENAPEDSRQVILPIGQFVDRTGLANFAIDFRPEDLGGKGAYHAMMIGTTGSGKSIFMQSMVLAAAHKYSPKQLNFMFMDFKAGAAELKKVSDLPHSVGMVTDLSPELADRALQALENELSRRKNIFDSAGKISDIWDFNRRFADQTIPHLLVVIDEFAEGINILPNLVNRLKELGRQGRAFGMYFFLANQEVNSAVDQLKANASWYVLLKVNRKEEMSLIGRNLPVPPGRGRGYVKVKDEITTIQSAYAGLPANLESSESVEVDEYIISTFGPDGERKELYRYDPRSHLTGKGSTHSELDLLVTLIKEASHQTKIPHAKPIYLEPLEPAIPLTDVIQHMDTYRLFDGDNWEIQTGERNVLPLGYLDIPQRCQQTPFSINFNEEGGHLWIIGTPGSGKEFVLLSIATMLALTHTPAEVHIYAFDFGNGSLSYLTDLPHTAAVIRAHEKERIERLFRFLDESMRMRGETDWRSDGYPEIYLIVNNVTDLRQQYPEQAEALGRLIRSGGAVGIHLIITSNRGSELPRSLSGSITRRLVLQQTEKQDYMDVINAVVPPLTMRTEGRGYYVSEGNVAECQIAIPEQSLLNYIRLSSSGTVTQINHGERAKERTLEDIFRVVNEFGTQMRNAWTEALPKPVKAMDDVLPLAAFAEENAAFPTDHLQYPLSLGIYFDTLLPAVVDTRGEVPFWTILGPRQSGKSTMLLNIIHQFRKQEPAGSSFDVFSFRKGPLSRLTGMDEQVRVTMSPEEMVEILNAFPEKIENQQDQFHVLMMDDLGLVFSTNNTPVITALNQFSDKMSTTHYENFIVVIADLYSNLKSPQTFSSSFIKTFQQSQMGIFFSLNDTDMQWFNTRVNLQYRKQLKWLPGRGFLVYKGKTEYMQTPLLTSEDVLANIQNEPGEKSWEK